MRHVWRGMTCWIWWAWKPEHQARNTSTLFSCQKGHDIMTNTNNVHIGRLVQSVFDKSGMSVSELSRQLHCERTNVYTIFKRRTIDIELLAKLSLILKHNFLNDAVDLYGLNSVFSPILNISIDLGEFTEEKMERLVKMVEGFK